MTSDIQFGAASTRVFPWAKSILRASRLYFFFFFLLLLQSDDSVQPATPTLELDTAGHHRHTFSFIFFNKPGPRLGLFGSSRNDRVIGLHGSLPVFDNLPHLLSGLSGQAAYKSFTGLINCLKSAPLPGK